MQRFFRLLAGASLTQVAFWTSYAFLPAELSGSMGYWGIFGSGAFVLIARHFAMVRRFGTYACVVVGRRNKERAERSICLYNSLTATTRKRQ